MIAPQHPLKPQSLIEEYGRLQNLSGHNPQSRGQRCNAFIAELLQSWGIEAIANQRASGEIDVAFVLNNLYFILEAKWEREPSDTGAIAKLQKRLRQRLVGTTKVFLSMAGFTTEALYDLKQGEQLGVLCLSREHLESMLSGFTPPSELINQLMAKAAFLGEGFVPITTLFSQATIDQSSISFETPKEISELVLESLPKSNARTIISGLPFGQYGIARLSDKHLLITLTSGVPLVDLNRQPIVPWFSFPNCSRNVIVDVSGGVYIVRRIGVAYFKDNHLKFVAGGLIGNVSISQDAGGNIWAFSNGLDVSTPTIPPFTTKLGMELGDQVTVAIDYPASSASNSLALDRGRFLIAGGSGVTIIQDPHPPQILTQDLANPMGLIMPSPGIFWIASDPVGITEINVLNGETVRLVNFALQGSVSELARYSDNEALLFSHYSDQNGDMKGIVVLFQRYA